jgi:hypothetical protein
MQIGAVADGDRPHRPFAVGVVPFVLVQREGAPVRGRPDSFMDAEAHLQHGCGNTKCHGTRVGRAGIAVGRQRHLDAGIQEGAGRSQRLAVERSQAGRQVATVPRLPLPVAASQPVQVPAKASISLASR